MWTRVEGRTPWATLPKIGRGASALSGWAGAGRCYLSPIPIVSLRAAAASSARRRSEGYTKANLEK